MNGDEPSDRKVVPMVRLRMDAAAEPRPSSAEIVDDVRILAARLRAGDGLPLIERFRLLREAVWREGRRRC